MHTSLTNKLQPGCGGLLWFRVFGVVGFWVRPAKLTHMMLTPHHTCWNSPKNAMSIALINKVTLNTSRVLDNVSICSYFSTALYEIKNVTILNTGVHLTCRMHYPFIFHSDFIQGALILDESNVTLRFYTHFLSSSWLKWFLSRLLRH